MLARPRGENARALACLCDGKCASIGDGHTAVYPPTEGELAWHLLPFFPVRLEDGWYVAAAPPEYAHLVGAKLLKAAGRDWQEMVDFTAGHLASDNVFTARWLTAIGLQFAELYALVSGRTDLKEVELVAELADGTRVRANLVAQPITRNPNAHWAPEGWTTPYEKAPLWLRDPTRLFYYELLPETGVVYARILQMADGEEQSLAEYGRALREFFTGNDARALILDLRLNNGGDANQARDLIDELIRTPGLEKPGSLAVLTGPRTFSATGYLLGMMEKHLAPVLVGWPTGCRPVGYSSERSFRLPYSGLSGSISHELRIDGNSTDDVRPSFFPHHPVWPTGEDLRQSRDPVLATALQALR